MPFKILFDKSIWYYFTTKIMYYFALQNYEAIRKTLLFLLLGLNLYLGINACPWDMYVYLCLYLQPTLGFSRAY